MDNQRNKIIDAASQCIEIEFQSLGKLKSCINDDFINAVLAIQHLSGRLIATGIGKSAIVAQKIVATLNSTGTPSIFMHAADAIHGDLGMLRSEDIVLCISKSGETPEIKVLIPLIKMRSVQLIGMCSNLNSYLAQQSDFVLHIPIDQEADPNNLAPTASTTSQMAMGDALAVSLLALRNFSPNDFAHFHPGGSLGKQLYLTAGELCRNNARPIVHLKDNLKKVLLTISSNRLGATAVLDDYQNLCGVITDGDIRRLFESTNNLDAIKAEDIMNKKPKFIQQNEMAVSALRMIQEFSISQILVMNDKEFYGILHLHDLLKEGII